MWIIFSLGASVLWGLTYVVNEHVYKKISIVTSLGITSVGVAVAMFLWAFLGGFLKKDMAVVAHSRPLAWLVIAETLLLIGAELCIGLSITAKNATLAGLIEISYPIFIALFAYLIFREKQFGIGTVLGGILIFAGVLIVYYSNK